MEMPAKQTPAASSEIVKLIRKLRWIGLEETEQLENKLEHQAAIDTVVSIQSETDSCRSLRSHIRTGPSLCLRLGPSDGRRAQSSPATTLAAEPVQTTGAGHFVRIISASSRVLVQINVCPARSINRPEDPGNAIHKRIEMILRHSGIVRAANYNRGSLYFFEPGAAIERS